jgi:hypothetical protein
MAIAGEFWTGVDRPAAGVQGGAPRLVLTVADYIQPG